MNKQQAIQVIEDLFPADSKYADTAAIGKELLQQAKDEVSGWRGESDAVLIRYAQLCMDKERGQSGI